MIKGQYIDYNLGNGKMNFHIDAVHAMPPKSDEFTGTIVGNVIQKINAPGIISKISRNEMDINCPRTLSNSPAIDEYRNCIEKILKHNHLIIRGHLKCPYLHLAIHGMEDNKFSEFEIGTRNGDSCSKIVLEWFVSHLSKLTRHYRVNEKFPGDQSKAFHRMGDFTSGYKGYGENFNTIQIEINRSRRKQKANEIGIFLQNLLIDFQLKFYLNE